MSTPEKYVMVQLVTGERTMVVEPNLWNLTTKLQYNWPFDVIVVAPSPWYPWMDGQHKVLLLPGAVVSLEPFGYDGYGAPE